MNYGHRHKAENISSLKRQQGYIRSKAVGHQCVSNIREVHNALSCHFLFKYLQTEGTTEPKYWHRSNLLSPLMNIVLSKLQDNHISYKITKIIFNGDKKGGACAHHLRINSNTHTRQDYMLSVYVRGAYAQ